MPARRRFCSVFEAPCSRMYGALKLSSPTTVARGRERAIEMHSRPEPQPTSSTLPLPLARNSFTGRAGIWFMRTPNRMTRNPANAHDAMSAGGSQSHHGAPRAAATPAPAAKRLVGIR